MYSIKLQNIRGIRELEFPFPTTSGVYVLTGTNGCGKTSLMVALNRLEKRWAFSAFPTSTHGNRMDLYRNSSVTYATPNGEVTYRHGHTRWTPIPRKNTHVLSQFPFRKTIFVTASSSRFFTQNAQLIPRTQAQNAIQATKDAMNSILETQRFDNLQYYTVNPGGNRKKYFYRSDKLYFINNHGNIYSESNFSFGESLLLNTLNALENIQPRTLLLIDEAELALHPRAQVRLYDYLEVKAIEKDLAIIISTHSSTLIRHAKNRYFLEKDEKGNVTVLDNCMPTYILRQVADTEEHQHDFYFFVEDDMAEKYLSSILRHFENVNQLNHVYSIEPIGDYKNVIKFVQNINSIGIPKKRVQAVVDADVNETYQELLRKANQRTQAENALLKLFHDNSQNISYLSITPELGVWQWVTQNRNIFEAFYRKNRGQVLYGVANIISQTSAAINPRLNANPTQAQLRHWAKECFKDFSARIHQQDHSISEERVVEYMIECYVENTFNNNAIRGIMNHLLNR